MTVLGRRRSIAGIAVGALCLTSTALWAGDAGFGDLDNFNEEEGRPYFRFVKDTNATTMPDAKVTLTVKNRGGVVTRTDARGAYKVPGFGKDVSHKGVQVTCDKPGYKQVRINRRIPAPTAELRIPIETECVLQRS